MFKKLFLVMLNKLSEFGELQSTHLYTDFANIDKKNSIHHIYSFFYIFRQQRKQIFWQEFEKNGAKFKNRLFFYTFTTSNEI